MSDHATHLTYTIDDDGIHLVCSCGHSENLGQNPTVDDAVIAAEYHVEQATRPPRQENKAFAEFAAALEELGF